jgi:glycosyltransferase involved in cell wall biosynthesis|tara:strand:- start:233 stop:985 length:753 start_codon:yes stop_codon:yes gene_type:complete
MKFSIITPNYNGAEYIEECIKSVLRQNVDFEHIIIDGSSTDSSLEILNRYHHLKIISENDNGMYDAINKGLLVARGEFISYLNVDDRYSNGALKSVEYEFNNNSNLDYVYGDCQLINQLEAKLYVYRVPPICQSLLTQITVIPWAQPSVIYKRKVFDEIGNFNINYLLASDYHFMKRVILSRFNGFGIKKVIAEFMKRNDSLSSKYLDQMNVEVLKIKIELQLPNHYLLDLFFNIYRKFYNFQTFLKKGR